MPRVIRLDQIEIAGSGVVGVRLLKQVVDAGEVLFSEPHRSSIAADVAVADQMAEVNAHLQEMGWPALPPEDIARIEAHATLARDS